MVKSKIIWDKIALNDFNNAIHFIADNSIQNAEKVKKDILDKISRLTEYPLMYAPDKYKKENDSNYRAFESYRYRISYHVSVKEIRILQVRHTSRTPKIY